MGPSLRHAAPALLGFAAVRALGLMVLAAWSAVVGRDASRLLVRWDAQWYVTIAEHGYGEIRLHPDGRALSDFAFFPMLPWSERAVAWLFDVPFTDAGLAVSWVASLVAAWGIFPIGDHLYDRRVGVLLAVLWAAVPIGIVESMAYTESLFTALASWSLYGVLTRRWLWAGGLAALAGLTRPVGLAVVAAVTVTAVVVLLREPKPTWRLAAGALIAPLGWLGYVAWVGVELGSPRAYFAVTDGWGNGFDGGIAFARWVWALLSGSSFLSGALVCLALALLALLVAGSAAYGAFWLHGPGPP